MTKTKIIASINNENTNLKELLLNGVDVVCLDKSFLDYDSISRIISKIKKLNKELNLSTAIMIDLEGPCIKTGKFKNDKAIFKTKDRIRMHMNPTIGSEFSFSVNCPVLINYLKSHSIIKLNEGKVILEVLEIGMDYALCEVIQGGTIKSNSKIYLPDIIVRRKYLTDQMKEDIIFASKMEADYLLISNVTCKEDILEVNDLLINLKNDHLALIPKIDNDQIFYNIDKIINVFEGIAISPKELIIFFPMEKIHSIKNQLIKLARDNNKISIVINENIEKEITLPTMNEINNDILLSADAIFIKNNYFKDIKNIIKNIENNLNYEQFFNELSKNKTKNISEILISNTIYDTLYLDCKAIVIITKSHYIAKEISKYRPKCEIFTFVENPAQARSLNLLFAISPIIIDNYKMNNIILAVKLLLQKKLNIKPKDKIIIIGNSNNNDYKEPNFITIEEV